MTLIYAAGRIVRGFKPLKHVSFLLSFAIKKKTENCHSEFKFTLENNYQQCYVFMQVSVSNFDKKRGRFSKQSSSPSVILSSRKPFMFHLWWKNISLRIHQCFSHLIIIFGTKRKKKQEEGEKNCWHKTKVIRGKYVYFFLRMIYKKKDIYMCF